MILNCMPVDVTIKVGDELTVIHKAHPDMLKQFQCVPKPSEAREPVEGVNVVAQAVYELKQPIELPELVNVVIVTMLAAQTLVGAGTGGLGAGRIDAIDVFGRHVRVLVPYSGPDSTKCGRSATGQILWINEFIEYT